jgi:hypothetical protein
VAVTTLRSRFLLAAVVLVVPALAGCSRGFDNPTDQVYNPSRGVNDRSGTVDVLNALVVSGEDGFGTVVATLVNNEDTDDKLTGVTVEGEPANISGAAGASDIAAGGLNNLGASGAVTAAADTIEPGAFVDVTFTFQGGKAITVEVPVVSNSGDYADVSIAQPRRR